MRAAALSSQLSHRLQEPCDIRSLDLTDTAAQRRFDKFVADYDAALVAKASTTIAESDGMPIHRAMRAIGGREKPWGPAIVAMLSGRIGFSLNEGDDKVMDRVRIRSRDLAKLVALRFDPTRHLGFAFETAINGRDVEELLNIFPKTTRAARAEGSLPAPVDGAHDRAALLDLAAKRISVSEVLARWNGRDRKLPDPLRGRGRPVRLDALGWDRGAVETTMETAGVADRGRPDRKARP